MEFLRNQTPNGAEEKVQALASGTDHLFNTIYGSKQDAELVAGNLLSPTNAQACVTKVNPDSTGLPNGNLTMTVLKSRPEGTGPSNVGALPDYSRFLTIDDNGNVK